MKSLVSLAWALSLATVRKKSGFLPLSVRPGVVAVGEMAMRPASWKSGREAVVGPEQMGPTTTPTLSEMSLVAALVAISGLHWSSWATTSTWRPSTPPLALT